MRSSSAVVFAFALALTSTVALAQSEWGIISTGGDPDPVHAFDLSNPAGTVTQIGSVQSNNNRGMDFLTHDIFYYFVSTDALNSPGERGLWRWNNGVMTQLFSHGFSDGGDGDATLSPDGTKFYVTADDQDGITGDSLYVFENLNGTVTFTEIGETGLGTLFGLAMDPISGTLYAAHGGDDSIYKLDIATGSPTLVGPVGNALGAIGGMDFSADGQTLLLSDAGELLIINPATGAGTAAGDTTRNDSALSHRPDVPEPASLALVALAGVIGMRRRSRA
jgi:hypothetical protein